MKKSLKVLITALSVTFLFALLCVCSFAADAGITSFAVDTKAASDQMQLGAVKWYLNSSDGKYYVFLPSGTDMSSATVWFNADDDVYCGETKLASGIATDAFAAVNDGTVEFTLTCGEKTYTLDLIASSGIPTIYINTASGSLDAIHADKEYKEAGTAEIVGTNGKDIYNGALEYIKGRGNSTWLADKKPYNIKLDKKTDLFGMGKSKKWCLLANSSDQTQIRNQLAYKLSQNLGTTVTSDVVQTNLYINGNYMGTYTVTEKVEIDTNRIDIYNLEDATQDVNDNDIETYSLGGAQNSQAWNTIKYANIPNNPEEITGGYLLELEKIYRYTDEASGFITNIGQAVVVKTPEYASKAQVEYISSYYQDFENALYSSTGYNDKGKYYTDYIDIESLARMYILDEYTENFDGCSSSFYLYKDVDGKLTAGPAWDFDLILGSGGTNSLINYGVNTADPSVLYQMTCYIGNHNMTRNSFLSEAFNHTDFQQTVSDIWADEFLPYFDTFKQNITDYGTTAKSSVIMNAIRWNIYGTTNTASIASSYDNSLNYLRSNADARYSLLSNALSSDTFFVRYETNGEAENLVYDTTMYKAGDTATLKSADAAEAGMLLAGWSTEPNGAGTVYKAGDKIELSDDTTLYAVWEIDSSIKGRFEAFIAKIKAFFEKILKFFLSL